MANRQRWIGAAALGVLLLALGTSSGSQSQPQSQPMLFGVIIWRSPTLTAQFWNPILRWVSDRSGVPLQLKVASTGPQHQAMVRRGELHFLYSNHNFIKDNERSGYRVFARASGDAQSGEIVVLNDAEVHALEDLKGKDVVFPHVAEFLGYHLPMDALVRKGIDVNVLFAGNQEGAIAQLKAGRAVAAGVDAEVMRAFSQRENLAYRVLWSSDQFLNLALSSHPSVPAAKVTAVRGAFLRMAEDPEGAKVLVAAAAMLKQSEPLKFIAARDADFDNMRRFYRNTPVKVELR